MKDSDAVVEVAKVILTQFLVILRIEDYDGNDTGANADNKSENEKDQQQQPDYYEETATELVFEGVERLCLPKDPYKITARQQQA